MEYHMVHPFIRDQRVVIQFLGVEGCQPAEVHRLVNAVCGAAYVLKTGVDWLSVLRTGRQQMTDMSRLGQAHIITNPENIAQGKNTVHDGRCQIVRFLSWN
jgi:hypothetical protein